MSHSFAKTKVAKLDHVVFGEEDVLGLDVAVKDNGLALAGGVHIRMTVSKSHSNLSKIAPDEVFGEQQAFVAASLDDMGEVATVAELHDDVEHRELLVEKAFVVLNNVFVGRHALENLAADVDQPQNA